MSLIRLHLLTAPTLALGLAGVLLAGCAGGGGDLKRAGGDPHPETPTTQYKAKVIEEPETLALAPHTTGLSDNQRRAIATFVARWREDAPGGITLRVPQGGQDGVTPGRMAAEVMQALQQVGVGRNYVRTAAYDGTTEPAAPVVLSYWRYTAEIPDCSKTWNNVVATGGNKPSTNFGCSSTANFAAMVADPRDILRPAATDPADPLRREQVLSQYRKGELTSTKKDEQASGTVSRAVN